MYYYFLHSLWGLKLKAIEALDSVQPQWCLVAESGITTETPATHCGCIKLIEPTRNKKIIKQN